MHVLLVSSEVVPFAKTGGLADVAGALPRALASLGIEVTVALPRYRQIDGARFGLRKVHDGIRIPVGERQELLTVFEAPVPGGRALLLEHEGFFGRNGLYQDKGQDYPDNAERFTAFARGVTEMVRALGLTPDVLHCNDWQTGLIPPYLKTLYAGDPVLGKAASLFTIHNLGYQGLFPAERFSVTGLPRGLFQWRAMEFYGRVNFLKGGLVYADCLSTVSRRYSQEIQTPEFGAGLEGVLKERAADLYGILNGVDTEEWSPATDKHLAARYSRDDLGGKAICKADLQRTMGLPVRPDVAVLGVISRLADQKGIDLVAASAEELLAEGTQLVLLGTGDPKLEAAFTALQRARPSGAAVRIGFDVGLSHKIEAGADLFLMPSRYEPCGLNQMYSLLYGTIPVVRATGGLDDTIVPFDSKSGEGNGFKFTEATAEALLAAVREALACYRNRPIWHRVIQNAMGADVSWSRSAREYVQVYRRAIAKRRGDRG
jgi:starch synthase